jgi:hypothetical protein
MAFTRSIYDNCDYKNRLGDNEGVLHYTLNGDKYYSCNQKRIEFGLLGGNNVSQSKENLVDLESDLRNQTRLYSKCPTRKYRPNCDVYACGNKNGYPCGDPTCQPNMYHMQSANLIDYRPRFNNKGYTLDGLGCNGQGAPTNPTMFMHQTNNAFKYAQGPVAGNKIPFGYKSVA